LTASAQQSLDAETETLIAVAHALRGEGHDASEDGTGRGTPLVAVAHPLPTAGALSANGGTTKKHGFGMGQQDWESGYAVPIAIQERAVAENPGAGPGGKGYSDEGAAYTLEARTQVQAVAFGLSTQQEPKWAEGVSPTLALPSKTGGGQVSAVAFGWQNSAAQGASASEHIAPTLDKSKTPAVAFDMRGREGGAMPEGPHDTANIRAADGGSSRSYVAEPWAVRRLTPEECEALQGFPRSFTRIPYRGKPAEICPDGPRYKALGNSWAVNVAEWVGERINEVDGW